MKKTLLSLLLITNCWFGFSQPMLTSGDNTVSSIYSKIENWAAHPWIKDNSDSIPAQIRFKEKADSLVDVFFIHPTTYTDEMNNGWNASIEDLELNKKTDESAILYQASVFNGSCRVFAPRYRQAHIKSFYIDKTDAKSYFDMAYEDVVAAFDYYLKNYNSGRAIIIAGHSQGTVHAARLLKDYFDNKSLGEKLVAAYLIGMPIPLEYFSSIELCKNKKQNSCYVSWRTFYKGYEPNDEKGVNTINYGVVNPLNWESNNHEHVSIEKNAGGVLKNFNKIVPKVVDAQIHNNILWSCKPDVFGKIFFNKKNFHIGDINLFYINIRENIKDRIENYFKSN